MDQRNVQPEARSGRNSPRGQLPAIALDDGSAIKVIEGDGGKVRVVEVAMAYTVMYKRLIHKKNCCFSIYE